MSPWEQYTGGGEREDRRWRRWADRCVARLGGYEYHREAQRLAWELYCDGVQPARAASRIIRCIVAGSRRPDDEAAHYRGE